MAANHDERPLVLITNDDGIKAGGLRALVEMAERYADVVVVAPNQSYSGMSHSITIKIPLYAKLIREREGFKLFKVNGTPVDCIKLSVNNLLGRKPDFVLSGINHGSNSSASIHYSGTMGAAREAALLGIPAIGFSLLDHSYEADFTTAARYCEEIFKYAVKHGMPSGSYWNVNIPVGNHLNGIKVCRQANGKWVERFIEREDPRNRKYFWLTGYYENLEPQATDTDEYWLGQDYVTVVPCSLDATDHKLLETMDENMFNKN
jgi:5'-nucleotidase